MSVVTFQRSDVHRTGFSAWIEAVESAVGVYRDARAENRRRREVYKRTLRELESYRPHELHDLKIDPADFETLARQQAGWM